MRTAVLLEVEDLLFDTLVLRARALRDGLAQEGVAAHEAEVMAAHSGVPASVALGRIGAADMLDDVGRSLVLRRASDAMHDAISSGATTFDPAVRDMLERLAADNPLGVVTRAERVDAQHLLEQVGLDACVSVIRSLADLDESAQHSAWSDACLRLHADRGVAFVPAPLLHGAARAGLRTVPVGGGTITDQDGRVMPFAQVTGSFIASLF